MTDYRLRPHPDHPTFWQHRDRPVLLLGGSVEDNLFQIAELEAQLRRLATCGGNYVRCTMSSRDPGDVWPFARGEDGLYDLTRPAPEYWHRFEELLRLTAELDIMVQIELWDRFDFTRAAWHDNPFNPKNTSTYDSASSGLPEVLDCHPNQRESPFFRTVPALEDNALVRGYQERFVDRLLTTTLDHHHVLYCIDNETNEDPAWGAYWADLLRARAAAHGTGIEITEMWDAWDPTDPMHDPSWEDHTRYSFLDVSQANHQQGFAHWQALMRVRARNLVAPRPRPINSIKVYGANSGWYGTNRDALERFWRDLFAGLAAIRFHRPPAGLGLNDLACTHLRAARLLADEIDLFTAAPAQELLFELSPNEAYASAIPGQAYAVFFPDGGDVWLDTGASPSPDHLVRWLDPGDATWRQTVQSQATVDRLQLKTPRPDGYWVALVKPT